MFKLNRCAWILGVMVTASSWNMGNAFAAEPCRSNSEPILSVAKENIVDIAKPIKAVLEQSPAPPAPCRSMNLRAAPLHVRCATSKSAIYERVSRDHFGESWKGPDGLIWSDEVASGRQSKTTNTCNILGGTLPSKADLERGEASGFREVLPHMKDKMYWTSSIDPYSHTGVFVFDGDDGQAVLDLSFRSRSVRCVGR